MTMSSRNLLRESWCHILILGKNFLSNGDAFMVAPSTNLNTKDLRLPPLFALP